jgi:hypothetical protein
LAYLTFSGVASGPNVQLNVGHFYRKINSLHPTNPVEGAICLHNRFFFFVDFAVPMNLGIFNINNEEIKINPYGS